MAFVKKFIYNKIKSDSSKNQMKVSLWFLSHTQTHHFYHKTAIKYKYLKLFSHVYIYQALLLKYLLQTHQGVNTFLKLYEKF